MKIIKEEKLTERNWNTRLKAGSALRRAIAEEDYQGVIDGIRACYKEMLDKGIIDDWDYERWTEDLDMYAPDDEDIEDTLDYELGNLYDACDNLGCWIELDESLKESNDYKFSKGDYVSIDWVKPNGEPGYAAYLIYSGRDRQGNYKLTSDYYGWTYLVSRDLTKVKMPEKDVWYDLVDNASKKYFPESLKEDLDEKYTRLVNQIKPNQKSAFSAIQKLIRDGGNKIEVDGFYFPEEAVDAVQGTGKNYHLNSYMDLTTSDILTMIRDNDTVEDAIKELFDDYDASSAYSWGSNFLSALDSISANMDESLNEDLDNVEDIKKAIEWGKNAMKEYRDSGKPVPNSMWDRMIELQDKLYQLVANKSVTEDLDNVESTDNTVVVNQPTGAAEEDSKKYKKRFEDATKEPKDAPLFGAKKQPKPDEVEEPKAELKESKLALDESLFNEGVEDVAYQMADEIDERFREQGFISWDDFNEAFEDAYPGLIDWTDDSFNDLETDVRGILSNMGWETIFEGDDEGGLKLLDESLFEDKKALKEGAGEEKTVLRELQKKLRNIHMDLNDAKRTIRPYAKNNGSYTPLIDDLYEARNGLMGAIDDIDNLIFEDHQLSSRREGLKNEHPKGDKSISEASYRGYAYYEYPEGSKCHVRETHTSFVATNEHGSTIGESPTKSGCEAIIDEYLKKDESLSEASTLPTGGKDEKFDTDAWSVIYWELSNESEGSADRKMARRAKVNAPMDSRYEHVDPVNDFDLRVYAADESGFDLAKKIADAWGVKYKIENTNSIHANKFPEEKLQMTLLIPEEMIG